MTLMRAKLLLLILVLSSLILVPAAAAAGPCVAGAAYNAACDVDHDGDVDIFDIQLAAGHWNQNGTYTAEGWSLTGNAGTAPGTNFLGTTDNQALELKVNSQRALRLEPNGTRPNVIGGSLANTVTSGVESGTIAGGGSDLTFNRVTDSYGFIGGGYANTAGDNSGTVADHSFATVAGGGGNTASGWKSSIVGGWYNIASGELSFVGGGQVNEATGLYATVGGGYSNVANGSNGTVAGGDSNQAAGTAATVGGGLNNWASGYGVVSGGRDNVANPNGTVPGGQSDFASGDYSFAAGRRAKAYFDGDFVWADSTDADFGSSAANQFVVRASGGVGLGTGDPANQLHVTEALNLSATPGNHVAQIENTSTGNSGDVLALKIGYTGNPLDSNNYVTFYKGNDASVGSIEGNGSGGVVLAGPGNLVVLWLPKLDSAEVLEPGDVVGVFGGTVSRRTDGADQLLVVGQNPIVAAGAPDKDQRDGYVMVALAGVTPVRVSGPVRSGDLIVPSGRQDGTSVAVHPTEAPAPLAIQAVGQAWRAAGEGNVLVAVGSMQFGAVFDRLASDLAALEEQNAHLEARISALEHGMTTTK
jgi:hypothetical protein